MYGLREEAAPVVDYGCSHGKEGVINLKEQLLALRGAVAVVVTTRFDADEVVVVVVQGG